MCKKRGLTRFVITAASILMIIFLTGSCKGEKEKTGGAGKALSVTTSKKGEIIMLPEPVIKGDVSLEEALSGRKSVRKFQNKKPDMKQVGQILWSAQGINRKGTHFKTCPSAGATYPLTAYVITDEGIFRYISEGHKLEKITGGDHREVLSQACLGQHCVAEAPLSVVFTAVYENTTKKYGERGIMYVHMEAGHAAQNIHLQAVALGMGSVPVGAFSDEKMAKILKCDKNEIPLYIVPVGYPVE